MIHRSHYDVPLFYKICHIDCFLSKSTTFDQQRKIFWYTWNRYESFIKNKNKWKTNIRIWRYVEYVFSIAKLHYIFFYICICYVIHVYSFCHKQLYHLLWNPCNNSINKLQKFIMEIKSSDLNRIYTFTKQFWLQNYCCNSIYSNTLLENITQC